VDEWAEAEKGAGEEQSVDVKALAETVWDKRRFVFKVTGIFIIIGILIILLSPVEYKAEATLLSEDQSSLPMGGLLQQFGGMLGLGKIMQSQKENLSPELYTEIVNSVPFQVQLLNREVTFTKYDTTVSIYDFWSEIYSPSVLTYLKSYTFGLPSKLKSIFSDERPPPLPESLSQDSVVELNKYQLKIIKAMRRHLNLKIDDEDGLVTLTVTMPDARAAAETGHAAIELLNKYVTDYRTHQAVQYLDFVEKQTEQARQDFYEIQTKLAVFQDQNINPATAKAKIQLKRLESKNNLLFNLYNSLEQQLEQAKFKVQQKTPVITVLEPVKVPVDNYKPQKKLIIIVALLVGLILSVFYITTRSILQGRETSIVK